MSVHHRGVECCRCGKNLKTTKTLTVDGHRWCLECFYKGHPPLLIHPIGFVRNGKRRTESRFGIGGGGTTSRLELFETQLPFFQRIEEETHLTVVYYLHQTRPVESAFSRGLDGKRVGLFATRTPDRPSRIAVSQVELVGVKGATLEVEGLDAIDGSPVLDIKLGRKALQSRRP